jgi:tyrosine-protein kinase Etk/Wzc
LRIQVLYFPDAVDDVRWAIEAGRVGREADIVSVRYQDSDPGLVWQVPNIIAERFIERRQEVRKMEARSQVRFLREQIDTLSKQLSEAEEDLKTFRERARVVSPQVEASSQVTRLIQLESERSTLDAERSSLATLMAEAEKRQASRAPGAPSAYRELLAFPSLLRSQAASQLLSSLAQVEDQRSTLLARRTEADADVKLLSARIAELEDQLATIARTYLQGLTNQLASLDGTMARFNSALRSLPQKELEYARLDRKPTVLKEMYTLLQTRLKEAEIAEAVENSGISVVDPAIPPGGPIKPRSALLMGAGLVGGLLVGLGLAVVREYSDRTVRTRADVQAASGLPVMAIIPRIPRRSPRPAVIAMRSQGNGVGQTPSRPVVPPSLPPPEATRPKVSYTFFASDSEEPATEVPVAREPVFALAKRPDARMTIAGLGNSVAEAYAILQTNIAFSGAKDTVRVLVLTSPLPSEGKTTTAVNLALTLCERGLSVCLIDADLRRGQVHEVFGLPRGPGLSEVLEGRETFEAACRQVRVGDLRNLAVLTSGAPVASPPGLVGSSRMGALLGQVRERYDLIVVDTPPVNILTDAALIGVHADGVLLVVRAGATDIAAVSYAMEQLHHVRAPALGVVLNDVDIKRYAAYDGAYRYASYESYLTADADQG